MLSKQIKLPLREKIVTAMSKDEKKEDIITMPEFNLTLKVQEVPFAEEEKGNIFFYQCLNKTYKFEELVALD